MERPEFDQPPEYRHGIKGGREGALLPLEKISKEADLSNIKKGKKKGADLDATDKFMQINLTPLNQRRRGRGYFPRLRIADTS